MSRILLWPSAILLCLLSMSGCHLGPAVVDTVPWWKGYPCMLIAPSSLEAMVWRDHLAERHQLDPNSSELLLPDEQGWIRDESNEAESAAATPDEGDWSVPLPPVPSIVDAPESTTVDEPGISDTPR